VRPIDVKTFKYKNNLALKQRRTFNFRAIVISALVIGLFIGGGYVFFFTPWLKVNNIILEGLIGQHQDDIRQAIEHNLNGKVLGVPVGRDILFVRSGSLEADLMSQFSFLEDVSIQKKYFNTLKIMATERQAEGVWCFNLLDSVQIKSFVASPDCRYFDYGGVTFGQAIQSSGVLLLNVDDLRIQSASVSLSAVDPSFLKAIQTVVPALIDWDVKVKKITIPAETYTEFDIQVSDSALSSGANDYILKFNLDSDLVNQLDVFRIFRNQKMIESTLRPQYIDLRFDGRVYFK